VSALVTRRFSFMAIHDAIDSTLEPATSTLNGTPSVPRVYAVLVVNNAAEWLAEVLDTFGAQRYADLDLVVVDNGSRDGSADIIAGRVPPERSVRFRRNVGFGRAVEAALKRTDLEDGDFVLLLHDDLVLAPDAIARLVEAFRKDPELSIAGPKLREWSVEPILQEVGGTIDRFGRAETPLEPGELDQGQFDRQREVLYVSTAGMLLRAETLKALGGFNTRYQAFRDDLDLCWRAWMHGHRVEIVPAAVGYHIAAAARRMRRLGLGRVPRELAERHTLATLIANYELRRLLWILPVVGLLAIAKTVGFVVTRRVGDAVAVLRAYAWNLIQLPNTLRHRRRVQRGRTVSDAELAWLFAPGLPRFRTYLEALADWVAGGSTRAFLPDEEERRPEPDDGHHLLRSLREHPAAWVGGVLALVYLIGVFRLLGTGQIVGGEILPWPSSPSAFLRSYVSPWSGEPFGSPAAGSPAQMVLGVLALAGLGSAWLAQRLVVLGLLPLAWVSALRAGRLVTSRPGPRTLGATLYALSPVLLGALGQGLLSVLVVAALLPAMTLLAVRIVAPAELWSGAGTDRTSIEGAVSASAWRAAALFTLGLTVWLAAAPELWPLAAALLAATFVVGVVRREGLGRLVFVALATAALLAPWVLGLAREGWALAVAGGGESGALPLWRALLVVPEVLPGLAGPGGVVVGSTAVAVFVPALLYGFRGRQVLVPALVTVFLCSAFAAWGLTRLDVDFLWTPALLLPAALALAGLGVVAGRWLPRVLRETTAGLRQVALMGSVALLGAGLVIGMVRLGTGPYEGLARRDALLPAFLTADEPLVGPYRILLVDQTEDGTVTFEATSASGVSMAQSGTVPSESVVGSLTTTLETMVGDTDPSAATGLGVLGVRYVVLGPDATPELVDSLDRQRGLSPIPFGDGRAYRVATWLPRASVLPTATGEQLLVTGAAGEVANAEQLGLRRLSQDRYRGTVSQPEGGVLVLGEAPSSRWNATGDGRELERVAPPEDSPGADLPVNAFLVPPGVEQVEVAATSTGHLLEMLAQAFLLLAVASLALRPPGGGLRLPRGQRRRGRGGVAAVRLPAHFDSTGELVSAPLMPLQDRSR
jgi:GT2 family glycosyltransferase